MLTSDRFFSLITLTLLLGLALLSTLVNLDSGSSLRFQVRHEALRDQCARWGAGWEAGTLGLSPAEEILVGRDGWLYFVGKDARYAPQILGQVDHDAMQRLAQGIHRRAGQVRALGGHYFFVVVPDKSTIVIDGLPAEWRHAGPGAIDELAQELRAQGDEGLLIDLRGVLNAVGPASYCRRDSHWTSKGAQAAAAELLRRLGRGAEAARLAQVPVAFSSHEDTGDLAAFCRWADPPPVLAYAAMPGPILVSGAQGRGALKINGDSFLRAWRPWLTPFFSRIDSRDIREPLPAVQRGDLVMEESVERHLPLVSAQGDLRFDGD